MKLPEQLKARISKYANPRDWFAFKDFIMSCNDIDRALKATIIGYGLSVMIERYPMLFS
jgi:hypothetical protein